MSAQHGVIFDMDGVLVASGRAHAASWRLLAKQRGVDFSDEAFQRLFGRTSRDIVREVFGPDVTDEQIAELDAQKEALYRDLITGMVPLTIGVREVLTGLADAGFRLAIATSGPPENVNLVLDEGRLRHFFSAVVTGFDVQRGKPAPDCFLLAAERLSVEPAHCVVVEDAPAGIEAARAAGMTALGFVGTHPAERLEDAGAAAVAEQMSEITADRMAELLGR